MYINSNATQATNIYPSYTCNKDENKNVLSIVENHNQYRSNVQPTEFSSEFSRRVWESLVKSGRTNLANKYATDIPEEQRCIIYNGKTKADVELEIAENSSIYGGKFQRKMDEESSKAFHEYKLNYANKMIRAYGLDKEMAKIDDFKFPRFGNIYGSETPNEWWEKSIQEIISLIGEHGWVEIGGEKIRP